jgi:hypothetical protein
VLKLFFGADPSQLAPAQVEAHRKQLEELEQLEAEAGEMPRGARLALELGIAGERAFIRYWSELEEGERT